MLRLRVGTLICSLFISQALFADDSHDIMLSDLAAISTRACCKICATSKPCGDSCISKSFNCSKPQGCACSSSGSSSGGSSTSGGSGSGSSSGTGSNSSSGSSSGVAVKRASCPKYIARVDTGNFSIRKNYKCFNKATQAENKGYVLEPAAEAESGVFLRKAGKVRCPKFIADKRTGLYTTRDAYQCFTKSSAAISAGFEIEIG